ncbi:JAB domain-containing protein [Sphingobacterium bambusae]|uniref:JAB domain-containing protein n=1 Tax=Sphingobacterium bambusae TaxID=662858 RepID=A0ABW6B8S7_9SPHI|nr:JAB domain-containing protein [Sphingobacterium bambusae]WPL49151.1 JAB domain-containing protein [Sphingobacterium bambusae]
MKTLHLKNQIKQNVNSGYVNELALTYRKSSVIVDMGCYSINSSAKVAALLRSIWNSDEMEVRESFYLLCFSSRLDLLGFQKVADGGMDAILVDMRLLFSTALLCRSASIVIAHNHPSGTMKPSEADRVLTRQVDAAGKLLNINLNDHIILTAKGYYSFRDEGLL